MLSSLRPLRQRDFALIWGAALLSNIGSWMQTVAVGVLVTARTGQAGWTGLVAAAAFLPIGLLSPLGGVMADRRDRRRWLLGTTVGETGFAVALTVLAATGQASPAAVTVLVFGAGAMAAIGFPAYQAMTPDLVPTADLGAAISLSSAQFNLGRVVGPALAGLAIVVGGYSWAFAINALSFAAVLVALTLVRLPPLVISGSPETVRRRLVAGARATAANPACRLAVLAISVVALTASPFIALVPAVALKVFGSKAGGTAILITAQGIGAVLGALALTPLIRRYGRRRMLVADVVAVCGLLIGYGVAPNLWIGAAAILLVGATYIGVLAGCNTIIQLHAPPAFRGRMLGIYMMALGVFYPIGALWQGAVANEVGAPRRHGRRRHVAPGGHRGSTGPADPSRPRRRPPLRARTDRPRPPDGQSLTGLLGFPRSPPSPVAFPTAPSRGAAQRPGPGRRPVAGRGCVRWRLLVDRDLSLISRTAALVPGVARHPLRRWFGGDRPC